MNNILFEAWDDVNKVMHTNFQFIDSKDKDGNDLIYFKSDQIRGRVENSTTVVGNIYQNPELKPDGLEVFKKYFKAFTKLLNKIINFLN